MARAQCGHGVTSAWAVTNSCARRCHEGRDWRCWGDLKRPSLAVPAPGNSPELGSGGAACEGASRAVQIQLCLAAELVRESS